jgi:hypothetical protein
MRHLHLKTSKMRRRSAGEEKTPRRRPATALPHRRRSEQFNSSTICWPQTYVGASPLGRLQQIHERDRSLRPLSRLRQTPVETRPERSRRETRQRRDLPNPGAGGAPRVPRHRRFRSPTDQRPTSAGSIKFENSTSRLFEPSYTSVSKPPKHSRRSLQTARILSEKSI